MNEYQMIVKQMKEAKTLDEHHHAALLLCLYLKKCQAEKEGKQ